MTFENQGRRGRIAQSTAPAVSSANAASSTVDFPGERPLSSRAIAMIGPNSPTAPIAIITEPNRERRSPASRRTGSTVPSAVLVRAVPM